MTEAMSRHEIEDVLSSIRRLVSQDPQGRQAGQATGKPPLTGKLVLTSELRVGQGSAGARTPSPDDDTQVAAAPSDSPEQPDPAAPDSLLTRIKSAGSTRPGAAQTEPQDSAETEAPATSLEDAALEATLSRLESMLAAGGTPHPAPEQSAPEQPARAAQAESTDQLIDESMLQQLVAQIVRQELQGELGEKITRSIRKLVRAEVARELALRQK